MSAQPVAPDGLGTVHPRASLGSLGSFNRDSRRSREERGRADTPPGQALTRVGPGCRSRRAWYGSPPRFPRLRLGSFNRDSRRSREERGRGDTPPGQALTRVGPACRSRRAGYGSPPRFPRKPRGAVKRGAQHESMLPTRFRRVRWIGVYAPAQRQQELARCRELLNLPPREPAELAAENQNEAAESAGDADDGNLQLCPYCQQPSLVWVAVIPGRRTTDPYGSLRKGAEYYLRQQQADSSQPKEGGNRSRPPPSVLRGKRTA